MLLQSDIAIEVFRFFDRTSLAQLQQLARGLRDAVDRICPEYPLHRLCLLKIEVAPNDQYLIKLDHARTIIQSSNWSMAASQIAVFLHHAYVDRCDLGGASGWPADKYTIRRMDWTRLTDSLRGARVKEFAVSRLNFTSLAEDALSCLLDGPSVASIRVSQCVVHTTFVDDAFLAKCKEKRITSLHLTDNRLANGQRLRPRASNEALLDFCAREADAENSEVHVTLSPPPEDSLFLRRFLDVS